MTHDRTPAIIACMRDLADAACLAEKRPVPCPENYIAARAIASACDDVAAAGLFPFSGDDDAHADALWSVLRGDIMVWSDHDRAVACRIATRFAEVALALATQATGAEEAAWLWNAAGRLAGMESGDYPRASWEATQGAHALAMVGAAVGLSNIPKDPLDAGKAITDKLATSQRPVNNGPQVGDIIDAADVPRRTLVECPDKALVIRLPNGKGWMLDDAGGPAHSGWPWDGGMTDIPKVRVLALDIPADKCFAVAGMTPAEAREWLAHRVAGEAITDRLATRQRQVAEGPQVGDIIDASDVPPGTLFTRLDDGALIGCNSARQMVFASTSWPARDFTWRCRVMAIGLTDDECQQVARMTTAEAREWLAQRVAGEAV